MYDVSSRRKKREWAVLMIVSVLLLLLMTGLGMEDYFQSKIRINEVCSNNKSYVTDENEQAAEYVELYNEGFRDYDIHQLYLSDDPYDLKKVSLEGQSIPSKGRLLVFCESGGNGFSIDNDGETIYLSNEKGIILEQVEVIGLEKDTAYARVADGSEEWLVCECTPGMSNDIAVMGKIEMPVLSHTSGFYDEAFELEITSGEDTVIYYTLDGSTPDEGAYIYEGPISVYDKSSEPNVWKSIQNVKRKWLEYEVPTEPVEKAFLIRAIAMDNAGNKSDVVTATYFVGCEEFTDRNVVSLIADPEDLFDDEKGIYVTGSAYDEWYLNGQEGDQPLPNFRQKGQEWEREAVFELFEDSQSVFQQNVGIRIQGASGRESSKKRFSVYARKEYDGSSLLEQPLFDNEIRAHAVLLRDEIADAICQKLMDDRGIPYQRTKSISLFLNGEHWYSSYLREKYNDQYFTDYYGIEDGNLVMIEGNAVSCGVETDMFLFDEFYDYVETHDFSTDEAYEELSEQLDIQNYIDFLIANIYCTNMDFDMENTKNVVMWRSRETGDGAYSDGRWRFALYDMDAIQWNSLKYYEVEEQAAIDPFSQKPEHADKSYNQGVLYSALRKNDDFCRQFVVSCMDLMNTNFSVETINEKLATVGKNSSWLESFFEKRPGYMKTYLAREFELTGSVETITLKNADETQGTITINTVTPSMKDGEWSGEYFIDYPVTVTAKAAEGYEFAGWSGSVISEEKQLEVRITEGGMELKAEFRKAE